MGGKVAKPVPIRNSVPIGKTRICVMGFSLSHHTNRAGNITRKIILKYPNKYESWFYFDTKGYRKALYGIKSELNDIQKQEFENQKSSPFVFLQYPDGHIEGIGGRDKFCDWTNAEFKDKDEEICQLAGEPSVSEVWVDETPGSVQ